jgi:nucleotidyltransferase substrate binding protein (TIGR01987 family)
MTENIRWQQRLSNFERALGQLSSAIDLSKQRELSDLENQGMIQAFEFTHELAWNCLKDFLEFKGQSGIYGSRDATRKAFELQLIEDGENWMNMILSRNRTSHTYNHKVMQEIITEVIENYFPLFIKFSTKMNTLKMN